ncbi:RNA polymerase sigma factor [Edaphobacillus lindanitolerans]|uniref:RNA polymerase sigma-70 factor, ECF subfamily n=1 Tax=Edaphobacillus lindanitolerans TaxID=550447 RepID=A0A1U7PHX2_9BACI|nr:RNA polymerase sigma factor [Edaphobacillus lindanitolerans]SIT70262.1 RNA polymerase sigma-70 factor, ECF subfamily [Edaphobacillus lindanitolerans]
MAGQKVELIYEEYERFIYHLCLKLTRNKDEAEDLMQDVWLKVVRNEKALEGVDHVKAWLTTICMNTFRDRYRKTVRRSQHVMEQPDTLDVPILDLVPCAGPTAEDLLERDDLREIVQSKLGELDVIYRKTVLYFYVNQYSLIEIADLMKVSIGTVKSRLFRAKQRLKEMMLLDETAVGYVGA